MILNLFSKRVEEVRSGDNLVVRFVTGETIKHQKVKHVTFGPVSNTITLEDGVEIVYNSDCMVLVCDGIEV